MKNVEDIKPSGDIKFSESKPAVGLVEQTRSYIEDSTTTYDSASVTYDSVFQEYGGLVGDGGGIPRL